MKKNAGSVALTVAGAVLCAVFSFLLVCNVTIIVKGTLHPETPPTVLGVAPMVVLSGSMSGTAEDHIEVGDLIFTTKPDTEALQVGDVVAFKDGNVVVTHRIVAVTADESGKKQFITKGDANNTEDQQHGGSGHLPRQCYRRVQGAHPQAGRLCPVPAEAAGHGGVHRYPGVHLCHRRCDTPAEAGAAQRRGDGPPAGGAGAAEGRVRQRRGAAVKNRVALWPPEKGRQAQ